MPPFPLAGAPGHNAEREWVQRELYGLLPMSHRLEFRRYCLPFRSAVRTAHGPWLAREGIIVRVEDEAGRVGFGEAAPIPWFGTETVAEDVAVLAGLGAAADIGIPGRIDEGLGCLRFALSCAFGVEPGLAPAVQRLPVAALLPAGKSACAAADKALEAGSVAFKWKVGVFDDADERVILDDLLARLPGHARLRLDANGAWTTRRAARWLAYCADRPIEFVEQPVASQDIDALCGLAADYSTTLALDESVTGLPSLRAWLSRGWRGVLVVKPVLAGDPASLLALLEKSQADVVFSSAFETSLGRQEALRIAFAYTGPAPRALGFGVGPLFADERFDGSASGAFLTPAQVGHVNMEFLWNALN
jgi:o-succinylbenzoate synthase